MNPSPNPNNGVAKLMAEIDRIAQELRAISIRPLPATEDQIKNLVKLAERDRPLVIKVNDEAVAKQLVGKVEQQARAFQLTCDQLIKLVDDRTDYLVGKLKTQLVAVQASEAELAATAKSIPREVPINWLSNWKITAGVTLGPVLLLLLGQATTGQFSKVSKTDFEKLQVENEQLRQYNARSSKEGTFYLRQINRYRAKTKKAAADFPKYVPAE